MQRKPSAIAERELDEDRKVVLQQLPRDLRPAFSALWNLDLAFADVVATSSDPRLGAIRLAWWRERLEELDHGDDPPPEPRLRSVVRDLLLRGVSGSELSKLEDAWQPLLLPLPWGGDQVEGLRLRGRILFGLGARLMGADEHSGEGPGAFWSLADGALHCSDLAARTLLSEQALADLSDLPRKLPKAVRPLTVLAALKAVDLMRESNGLQRLSAAIRHRLSGTLPSG